GPVPRFRCTACGKTFSNQTFSVDYYAKRVVDYENLAGRLSSCECLRAMGRALGLSSDSVSNRIARAARQAIAAESRLSRTRVLAENLAADGFESFCVSQYHPNNIHLLVGSDSQFVYAANYVTLRRKGRMSEGQKRKRWRLERLFRPPPRAVEHAFGEIAAECLRVLADEPRASLTLWTDEKTDYTPALAAEPCVAFLAREGRLVHRTVSSRAARTRANPLFPVNYLDRELRKDLHEHVRETVCFGRNVNRQMERLALYLFIHNYLKRFRIPYDRRSHAEAAGYDPRRIAVELKLVWKRRAFLSLTETTPGMRDSWLRLRETPLKKGKDYLPRYAAA
ncbi:MAG: hypothetical protein JNG85_09575, partial [Spirochaetaceae bacterium]|nr:hypothetical protein [Spirochaetaceae bacterium]